jgi:FdhE protein
VSAVLAAALGAEARRHVFDAAALLEAAVAHDDDRMTTLAAAAEVDPSALAVAAQLAAVTLLQSCARALGPDSITSWSLGYCPVCGAQPTLAEVLGLERRRHLRCGRCGAGWSTEVLLCPFCNERDHEKLGSLVPDGTAGQLAWVETCNTCQGYLKVRATLRAAAPQMVLIEDARSVELDLAAAERGFKRPDRPGFTVRVRLSPLPIAAS